MSGPVRSPLGLVVDLVPGDGVVGARRRRNADGERQSPLPSDDQQFQNFTAFGVVR